MKLRLTGISSIFKWRMIAIVMIVALLIIATKFWFGDKNTHYLKTVGSCNQPTTIKIYDETGGFEPVFSPDNEEDPPIIRYFTGQSELRSVMRYSTEPVNTIKNKYFKKYINAISKYVFAKVDAMSQCRGASDLPKVQLTFVYRPAISREINLFNDFILEKSKRQDIRQLDSPWARMTFNKSPLDLKATFIWNERQFLLDQSLILGEKVWDHNPPTPIALTVFNKWQSDYHAATTEQEAIIVRQLPADMRWLFMNAFINHCNWWGGGGARCGLRDIMNDFDKPGYIDLNVALIDKFFIESSPLLRYDNVLTIKGLFNINNLKIIDPHNKTNKS
jgi:hypothetical protein